MQDTPTQEPIVLKKTVWDLFDKSQPLWLPAGSITALLTFGLLGSTVWLFATKAWAPPDLVAMTVAAVTTYVQVRANVAANAQKSSNGGQV